MQEFHRTAEPLEDSRLRYRNPVSSMKRTGNWSADGKVERAALRRDFLELTPAQRAEQVFELSRFMTQVAAAGRRRRGD